MKMRLAMEGLTTLSSFLKWNICMSWDEKVLIGSYRSRVSIRIVRNRPIET